VQAALPPAPPVVKAPAPQPPAAQPSAPQPSAPATVAAVTPPPAAPAPERREAASAGGGYRLQLGAVRTPDAAQHEWDRLKKAQHDILAGYGAVAARVDLGERGVYYRIQAGPVADGNEARKLCEELRQRKVECILVRP
jgi:cell division septation protein DedD